MSSNLSIRVLGGPTAFFDYGGLNFLTDPTFDTPREYVRQGRPTQRKLAPPSAQPAELGRIDVPERPLQLVFGGADGRTLFILTHHGLYAARP